MIKVLAVVPRANLNVAGLGLPFSQAEIYAEHDQDRAVLADLAKNPPTITTDDELAAADATLSDVARLAAELVARRQAPVKEIKSLISEVEGWFRPYIKDCEAAIESLKGAKSRYLTAKDQASRAAREAAQAAADAGDSAAVLANVQQAQALAATTDASKGTRYAWEVKRINPDLLPDEWWVPDAGRIAAVAKAAGSSDDAPVIPGVVFERVAVVQARRS